MPSERDAKALTQDSILAPGAAVRCREPSDAITDVRSATLDDAQFAETRDGYERAEMFQLALRATLRATEISLIDGSRANDAFRVGYYRRVAGLLRTRTVSGTVLLRDKQNLAAELGHACWALYDVERFEVAKLKVANYRKLDGIWTMLIKRASSRPLLMIGVPERTREILPLAADYPTFLKNLGKFTRRNVRKARERAQATAIRFTPMSEHLPSRVLDEVYALCRHNGPRAVPESEIAEWERRLSRQNNHFYSILTAGDGEIFSICRGFVWGKSAIIPYQLNHRGHYDKNPSLLHRAFLAEWLMKRGVREMIFPHGCAGLLKNVCLPDVASSAVVFPLTVTAVVKALVSLFARGGALLGFIGTLLPAWLRKRLGMHEL